MLKHVEMLVFEVMAVAIAMAADGGCKRRTGVI